MGGRREEGEGRRLILITGRITISIEAVERYSQVDCTQYYDIDQRSAYCRYIDHILCIAVYIQGIHQNNILTLIVYAHYTKIPITIQFAFSWFLFFFFFAEPVARIIVHSNRSVIARSVMSYRRSIFRGTVWSMQRGSMLLDVYRKRTIDEGIIKKCR